TNTPTSTPTLMPTVTPTSTPTSTPTMTAMPTDTLTPTITQTPDGSPPSIDSLEINKGALTTTSTNVILDLAAHDPTDGVAEMSFSNDQSAWSAWQPFANSVSWTLGGGDGTKTVYTRVRDFAGNLSPIGSATIQLDTRTAPEFSISINQGTLYTNQVTVTLTIGARPLTSKMEVSNDGGFNVPQEPYSSQKEWTITAYDGTVLPRTVYVRFRDRDGAVVGTATDDIILDVNAPTGSVSIGATNESQNLADNVTLKLNATDDLSGVGNMRISNNSSFTGVAWEPYAPTRSWTLAKNKVVFVQYRDNAGNISKTYATTTCTTLPAKPKLITPKKGSTVNDLQVALDWSDARCGTTFSLVVKRDSQTGKTVDKLKKVPVSQHTTKPLQKGKTYYWRVTACNKNGCAVGDWWSFKVK
ncbi:MAG: hypothetical protein HY741_06210, partial [Chloroflexi bacterium]|nr:hypothetical protein [Chloroflexota bacterium]